MFLKFGRNFLKMQAVWDTRGHVSIHWPTCACALNTCKHGAQDPVPNDVLLPVFRGIKFYLSLFSFRLGLQK